MIASCQNILFLECAWLIFLILWYSNFTNFKVEGLMEDRLRKTERVWKIWLLLNNNPFYFTTKALAELCEMNVKTIYRDLITLDIDLHVPVEERGT
jgi:hypothetical protein